MPPSTIRRQAKALMVHSSVVSQGALSKSTICNENVTMTRATSRRRRHEQARCSARAWCKLDGALRRRARWLCCLRVTHLAPLRRQTRATDAFLAAATKCVAYAQACGIWCAAELLQLRNLGTWQALLLAHRHQERARTGCGRTLRGIVVVVY